MSEGRDPGWGAAFRVMFPIGTLDPRKQRTADGLTACRSIFIGLVMALFLFIVAFSYVMEAPGPPGIAPYVVVVIGLLSAVGISVLLRRPLSAGSADSLVDSWRTRFFIGVGIAEIPALVGLALTLPSDRLWIYPMGMAFTLLGSGGSRLRNGTSPGTRRRSARPVRSSTSPRRCWIGPGRPGPGAARPDERPTIS